MLDRMAKVVKAQPLLIRKIFKVLNYLFKQFFFYENMLKRSFGQGGKGLATLEFDIINLKSINTLYSFWSYQIVIKLFIG